MAQQGWDIVVHFGTSATDAASVVQEIQALGDAQSLCNATWPMKPRRALCYRRRLPRWVPCIAW
jgi:hypothetical protein